MRDFLQKEVGLFNYLNKVNLIHTKPIAQIEAGKNKSKQPAPHFGSADLLIEDFFSRL
jgi:hypothetical protein